MDVEDDVGSQATRSLHANIALLTTKLPKPQRRFMKLSRDVTGRLVGRDMRVEESTLSATGRLFRHYVSSHDAHQDGSYGHLLALADPIVSEIAYVNQSWIKEFTAQPYIRARRSLNPPHFVEHERIGTISVRTQRGDSLLVEGCAVRSQSGSRAVYVLFSPIPELTDKYDQDDVKAVADAIVLLTAQ